MVDFVAVEVGKHEIEEHEVELLLLQNGDCLLAGADHHAAEPTLLQEQPEQSLNALVVVHHQHGGLALLVLVQDVPVERVLLDPPPSADLDGG